MVTQSKHPTGLVLSTNNSSQAQIELEELLTYEELMVCETENFIEYVEELAEKVVLLRHVENPRQGLIIRPCDSSRYFEGGQRKTKRNIKKRFGRNYEAPGTFVTLTYDHQKYSRWEAWERTPKDIKRFLHNITMRYKRAGRKLSPRYIWVIEEQSKSGYPHVHMFYPRLHWLLDKEDIQALWGVGRTRIEYSRGVNIGGYICKYITKADLMKLWHSSGSTKSGCMVTQGATACRLKKRNLVNGLLSCKRQGNDLLIMIS